MYHPEKRKKSPVKMKVAACVILIILVAVCVVLKTRVHTIDSIPITVDTDVYSPVKTLAQYDVNTIASIKIISEKNGEYTIFVENEKAYLSLNGLRYSVKDDYAADIIDMVSNVTCQGTVTETMEEASDVLADMGLEPAQYQLQMRFTDGTYSEIKIGKKIPDTTYSYMIWSEAAGIYMCDSGMAEIASRSADRWITVEQPTLVSELIRQISCKCGDNEITVEITYDENNTAFGTLVKPYRYPLAKEATTELISAVSSIRLGSAALEINYENSAFYGFDSPLCVVTIEQEAGVTTLTDETGAVSMVETEAATSRFVYGAIQGDHYVACQYDGAYYLCSKYLCQYFFDLTSKQIITKNPFDQLMDDAFSSVLIKGEGKEYQLVVDKEENSQDVAVSINGEGITTERAAYILEKMSGMTVSGDANGCSINGEEVWSVHIRCNNGENRLVQAYKLDTFSDAIAINGVVVSYVHGEWFDRILSLFEP